MILLKSGWVGSPITPNGVKIENAESLIEGIRSGEITRLYYFVACVCDRVNEDRKSLEVLNIANEQPQKMYAETKANIDAEYYNQSDEFLALYLNQWELTEDEVKKLDAESGSDELIQLAKANYNEQPERFITLISDDYIGV